METWELMSGYHESQLSRQMNTNYNLASRGNCKIEHFKR